MLLLVDLRVNVSSVVVRLVSWESTNEDAMYHENFQVRIGDHCFQCLDVLGKGSYSEVWRARVLTEGAGVTEVQRSPRVQTTVECRVSSRFHIPQYIVGFLRIQYLLGRTCLEANAEQNAFTIKAWSNGGVEVLGC
eukprot:3791624-Amphidinium_carterae.1